MFAVDIAVDTLFKATFVVKSCQYVNTFYYIHLLVIVLDNHSISAQIGYHRTLKLSM